jgi:hypothetical protein
MLSQQEIDTHQVCNTEAMRGRHLLFFSKLAGSLNYQDRLQVFNKRFLDLVSSGNLPAVDDLIDIVVRLLVVELFHVEHAGYVVL